MKDGLTLGELEQTVRGELEIKNDMVADSRDMKFKIEAVSSAPDAQFFESSFSVGSDKFEPTDHMLGQIASKLDIPNKYFKRMCSEAPELAERNVNHWLHETPKPYMVRALGTKGRAFLSNQYDRIDNWDVLKAIMPALKPFKDRDDLHFEQSHVTEKHLYLRLTVPSLAKDINPEVGDVMHYGIQVKNSEVGVGMVEVAPFIKRLVCLNGMTATDYAKNKRHLGAKLLEGEDRSILTSETIKQGNKYWIMTVQDTVDQYFNGTTFEDITNSFINAKDTELVKHPKKAIEYLQSAQKFNGHSFGFSESEGDSILENLLTDGDKSQFGMANAITRTATTIEDTDRSMKFEEEGWKMLTLPKNVWNGLAMVA